MTKGGNFNFQFVSMNNRPSKQRNPLRSAPFFRCFLGARTSALPESECSQRVASWGWRDGGLLQKPKKTEQKPSKSIPKNTEDTLNIEMVSYWMSNIIQVGLNTIIPCLSFLTSSGIVVRLVQTDEADPLYAITLVPAPQRNDHGWNFL